MYHWVLVLILQVQIMYWQRRIDKSHNKWMKQTDLLDTSEWERGLTGNCARNLIWPYYQMVYAQTRILVNEMHKFLLDFNKQTDKLIPFRTPDLVRIN